jgi:hypothetical protein
VTTLCRRQKASQFCYSFRRAGISYHPAVMAEVTDDTVAPIFDPLAFRLTGQSGGADRQRATPGGLGADYQTYALAAAEIARRCDAIRCILPCLPQHQACV